jgi:hypothetical protein
VDSRGARIGANFYPFAYELSPEIAAEIGSRSGPFFVGMAQKAMRPTLSIVSSMPLIGTNRPLIPITITFVSAT